MELNSEQHLKQPCPQSGTDKQAEIMERLSNAVGGASSWRRHCWLRFFF